jgi:hypothetical protein
MLKINAKLVADHGCQMVYVYFKPKIWVNFGGPWNEKSLFIL